MHTNSVYWPKIDTWVEDKSQKRKQKRNFTFKNLIYFR